jgi:hypothetical protein
MPILAWSQNGIGRVVICLGMWAIPCASLSSPAYAECAGSDAIDACIVGTWRSTGDGQAEWLRRHMPAGISFPRSRKTGTTTYGADGTYSAASAAQQTALVETGEGRSRSDGNLTTATTGTWSATDGQLNVCSTDHIAGSMRITAPDGSRQTVPLSRPAATLSCWKRKGSNAKPTDNAACVIEK